MAWVHGPKIGEQLIMRRRAIEMETMRDADWLDKRLVVIGGSMYPHRLVLHAILDRVHRERGIKEVIVNEIPNISNWREEWAKYEHVERVMIPMDFATDGNNAEFRRNLEMLRLKPDGVIAFPGGKRTGMMLAQAKRAKVPIWEPIKNL